MDGLLLHIIAPWGLDICLPHERCTTQEVMLVWGRRIVCAYLYPVFFFCLGTPKQWMNWDMMSNNTSWAGSIVSTHVDASLNPWRGSMFSSSRQVWVWFGTLGVKLLNIYVLGPVKNRQVVANRTRERGTLSAIAYADDAVHSGPRSKIPTPARAEVNKLVIYELA